MYWLDENIEKHIKSKFQDKTVKYYGGYGSWQTRRYVKIDTSHPDFDHIHYELTNQYENGDRFTFLEFHIESLRKHKEYRIVFHELRKVVDKSDLKWKWIPQGDRIILRYPFHIEWNNLFESLQSITELLDGKIKEITQKSCRTQSLIIVHDGPYQSLMQEEYSKDYVVPTVINITKKLSSLFQCDLRIPPYQRDYCWEENEIKTLWKDVIKASSVTPIHLGTIILQRVIEKSKDNTDNSDSFPKNISYNIIDGQQRLVTLSLILYELGYEFSMPLLTQHFNSYNSNEHIANAKYILGNIIRGNLNAKLAKTIADNIEISILVITNDNLDLAYTFFSNQNSKGVRLSDYDLLKAHHLRFLFIPEQAEHLAKRWNKLSSMQGENNEKIMDVTLGTHLYRLRKWMRKSNKVSSSAHPVMREYSNAMMLNEIPPFGERFYFYEKIQGGSHFFAYTEKFMTIFIDYLQTPCSKELRKHIMYGEHNVYADVIETLLFGYYTKFGKQYLPEAMYCICGVIAQHRYNNPIARREKVKQYAHDCEVIMMIDQASSPTFFLSEAREKIIVSGQEVDDGIQYRFYKELLAIFDNIKEHFTDNTIIKDIENEYDIIF